MRRCDKKHYACDHSVLLIIVACCHSVFRLKLSCHRQACSVVAFPALAVPLLWNRNHVRVWQSLCGTQVWTIWEPRFGESQKWTPLMLSPLERLIAWISSGKFILSDRISLDWCHKIFLPPWKLSHWPFNVNARWWNEFDRLNWWFV